MPQVVGAYNSTRHESTGFSPFMMLTGINWSAPLIFFYEEPEKETKPHYVYIRETMEKLREINKLARRNVKPAQLRQKKNYDARIRTVQKLNVGDHVLVFCRAFPGGGTLKLLAVWRGSYRIMEVHQDGRWYVLSNSHKAHFENVIFFTRTMGCNAWI